MVGQRAVAAVERGVEAGDLGQGGQARPDRADRRQVVGVVQRRQRHEALEAAQDARVDQHRSVEIRPPMHHPVADCDRVDGMVLAQPAAGVLQRRWHVGHLGRVQLAIDRRAALDLGAQPWLRPDAVDLALDPAAEQALVLGGEHLELDARGARIDDQDGVHGAHAACGLVSLRSASAYSTATAHDAVRASTLSAREVSTIGTRAPSTMPAASALARNDRFLASMLPASRSGTTRIWARPATSEWMPLMRAASRSMALSNASGPSRMPPVIWPRSAIL